MKRLFCIVALALAYTSTSAFSQVFQKVNHFDGDIDVVMYRSVSPLKPEEIENIMRNMIDTEKVATYLYLYPYNVRVRPDPIARQTSSQNAITTILRNEKAADWRWAMKYIKRTDAYSFRDCATLDLKCNPGKQYEMYGERND